MYVFGGEFTSTNETPLWMFNFREYLLLSCSLYFPYSSLDVTFPVLTDPHPNPTGELMWRKQAAKSWVS